MKLVNFKVEFDMRSFVRYHWRIFFLFQLLLISCFFKKSFAAAGEDGYSFFRQEVRGCKFQVVDGVPICRSSFYKDILGKIDEFRLRVALITNKEGITSESKKLNIACFAFEFFNQEGNPISFPFFFGHPDAQHDGGTSAAGSSDVESLLKHPHFFISGRLDKTKIEDKIDEKGLTYLSDPPTNLFYEYREMYKKTGERYEKLKQFFNPSIPLQSVQEHEKALKSAFQLSSLECCWVHHCDMRRKGRDFEDRPTHVKTLLRVEIERLRKEGERDIKIIKSKANGLSDENVFQHSEQLALARMEKDLEGFIRFVKMFLDSRSVYTSSIKSIVLHVFSRNTLCARCSSSIVLDFERDFRTKIIKTLLGIEENIPFYIIAATKILCDTNPRKCENLPKSLYQKIHDYPATEEALLRLSHGPKDGSKIYQLTNGGVATADADGSSVVVPEFAGSSHSLLGGAGGGPVANKGEKP